MHFSLLHKILYSYIADKFLYMSGHACFSTKLLFACVEKWEWFFFCITFRLMRVYIKHNNNTKIGHLKNY